MTRVIRAELFKLRTTSTWWVFTLATVVTTAVVLVVDIVNARSLLQPFAQYVASHTHDHGTGVPADFLARLQDEWTAGHDVVTQAATIYTSGQLIGVLLACLLGIVLITSEYHHQTATTTFVLTPRRTTVVRAKLVTAVGLAGVAWLVSTVISVVAVSGTGAPARWLAQTVEPTAVDVRRRERRSPPRPRRLPADAACSVEASGPAPQLRVQRPALSRALCREVR